MRNPAHSVERTDGSERSYRRTSSAVDDRASRRPHAQLSQRKGAETYFATHPDYAREAGPLIEANVIAARPALIDPEA
jgi:hypothetical protein